ncbi:MAG: adenylosuccinate lyase [Phycisphaeraceae bacterium]
MASNDRYESPLSSRNASPAMQAIWSPQRKFSTWRRLWLALAEAEKELGLPITDAQVAELRQHLDDIDFAKAAEWENKLRHDVMAHIHTLGEIAPTARPIIHLGATSQFVVCNTELLQIRDALTLVAGKLASAIHQLGSFAATYRDLPTLAFTHYQPAQPTTVGKRACLWAHDLSLALEEIEHRLNSLRFRGVKGTTGTQASFLELFEERAKGQGPGAKGNNPQSAIRNPQSLDPHALCDQLDRLVTQKMNWDADKRFVVTGQTYPRLVDGMVISSLAAVAAASMKFATDIRLLANRKEIEEPFETSQVGSSAMPYKRNPMRCERICGLARFVIGQTQIPFTIAAEQWFERTLDDSSTRRLSLPEPFLALDGVLDLMNNVTSGLVVYEKMIAKNLAAELPFMASENLMMAAVQKGADRQEMHELIREHAQAAAARVKGEGAENDLLERLAKEPAFAGIDMKAVLDPSKFVGRAPQQVDAFLREVVEPIRARYKDDLGGKVELKV